MKIRNFIVTLKNGRIFWKSLNHKHLFEKFTEQFADGLYRLTIDSVKPSRSNEQNNYYWLYLGLISEETGHSPDELHTWAKSEFLETKSIMVFGKELREDVSTTKLSKSDFSMYLVNIQERTGIELPDTTSYFGYSYHK